MYTGIVRACLPIASIEKLDNLSRFSIIFSDELLFELELGASVAVNGVCLTVSEILEGSVFFDVIKETLELSNLKYLEKGVLVILKHQRLFIHRPCILRTRSVLVVVGHFCCTGPAIADSAIPGRFRYIVSVLLANSAMLGYLY